MRYELRPPTTYNPQHTTHNIQHKQPAAAQPPLINSINLINPCAVNLYPLTFGLYPFTYQLSAMNYELRASAPQLFLDIE